MVWIIIVIIMVLIIFLYNRLVQLSIRTKNAWASIDNQLKRRADLIPNLLEVTKGYAKHERETLEEVITIRSGNSIGELAYQSEKVGSSIQKLLAVSEGYPDLKANELFLNLQIELTGTEDKIAYARQFYNDCVQHFNTAIMSFPNNLFAKMLRFKELEYFQVEFRDRERVDVKL